MLDTATPPKPHKARMLTTTRTMPPTLIPLLPGAAGLGASDAPGSCGTVSEGSGEGGTEVDTMEEYARRDGSQARRGRHRSLTTDKVAEMAGPCCARTPKGIG
ncbi:hypothetical protein Acsp02_24870 [Actinoplanes sp. NBRC 103695]|nr:hypothetical protein Acsp02_24870 [Actinoplanes sp. NBRC 103695]